MSEFAYKDIQEFESVVGYKVNDVFADGWRMARLTLGEINMKPYDGKKDPWVDRNEFLPVQGRVLTFSPVYAKEDPMRFRIMDAQFVKICQDVTHWRSLDDVTHLQKI